MQETKTNFDELAWIDATAQAELVRQRVITPQELLAAAIERIELINPLLNAVVTPMFEQAHAAASEDNFDGPFAGVPFLLKDLIAHSRNSRLTSGSRLMADYISPADSELVTRYRKAGLNIIGKTSTSEFGILGTTEPERFGPARNPWDMRRSTGGSSGGSAAAVAAGMVAMAHASDAGGSIRIPASCCGIFGLKPTRARNPMGPQNGDLVSGLWAEHAVTRSVRDSARLLDATGFPQAGDPYWAPPLTGPAAGHLNRRPGRLRIALSTSSPTGGTVEPVCIKAARDAAELCAAIGHDVSEGAPAVDPERLATAFDIVWMAGVAWMIGHWARMLGRTVGPEDLELATWTLYERGKRITSGAYLDAVHDLQRISRTIADFFEHVDAWLTPALATAPPQLGWIASTSDDPLLAYRRDSQFCPFTGIANVTGQPAMSTPLFWDETGLPVGTQFIGRFGEEGTLIGLAAQLEEARPWADKHPPAIEKLYASAASGSAPNPRT
jgi:amidase